MPYVMKIMNDATGRPTPFDGQYVVEYDPTRNGSYQGRPMSMHLVCTPDITQARRRTGGPA